MRVLVAEDDVRLAALLEQSLSEAGWEVEVVHDGRSAYGRALPDGLPYDVLLLDWMLPELDGVTVCRKLRDLGVTTPVLMLTARGDVRDRIHGLDAGADDYLPKPFDLDELLARLRALHRRTSYDDLDVIEVDDLVIDVGSRLSSAPGPRSSCPRGSSTSCTCSRPTPARSSRATRSSTRSGTARPTCAATSSTSTWRHPSKIDKPFGTSTITTVRGAGYRLERRSRTPRERRSRR